MDYHFITITTPQGRAMINQAMNDEQFQTAFWREGFVLPSKWKIVHIPVTEWEQGSKRVDFLRAMPVAYLGYWTVTLKQAIEMIYQDARYQQ